MKVEDVMTEDVQFCTPETNLATAAMQMWDHDCGTLPVVSEDGTAMGMITDRDICIAAATRHRDIAEIRVGELASGALHSCTPNTRLDEALKIFQQALQELGYIEGKNIQFEYRYTEGSRDQAAAIVAELVGLKVDILFSTQAIVVQAAKQATKTIPIVMAVTPDPVQAGLVDSLARPGGNITGLTSLARNLSGKRLELLTEMIPRLSRVGFLTVAGSRAIKDYEDAARGLKVPLQPLEVRVPSPDLQRAFQVAVKERVSAIILASVPGLSAYRKQIADLAIQNRLPLMSESVLAIEAGCLAFYGAKEEEIFRLRLSTSTKF